MLQRAHIGCHGLGSMHVSCQALGSLHAYMLWPWLHARVGLSWPMQLARMAARGMPTLPDEVI